MRKVLLFSLPLLIGACDMQDDGPTPYDDDYGVTPGNINEGAPNNDSLPDDNKADAVYPAKFELPKNEQSAVKSQGSRGVCSIFAATAIVENLYLKAGMPAAEVDFSEQYMQWSVKNQVGAFQHTEGSNVDDNLQAVVEFGDIKESDWAYESAPWTAANDPECTGGESLPTKCYTNGEPPQTALDAPKFKLPSSRWINTNSIKAHLTTKKTGVGVGLNFFYQSWNHRRSTIPVDSELWRQGFVTYPNDKDKTESATHRAGHAIEIIGWDDDLEIPMRDGEGKPILDANGQPKKEKGFFLFKNSWGTAGFGIDHPYGAGYGWLSMRYVKEYGSAVVGEVPVLNGPTPPPPSGGQTHSYSAMPASAIPDNAPAGVSSTIEVADAGTLASVKLTTDVTHTYRGDLKVTLTHGATTVTVFNGEGGSADDLKQTFTVSGFSGELKGTWTLKVVDTASQDVGTLNSWKLEVATN
ncbi:MAG TPA: proprotein convertase P-domain-containing protein [Kofleriaceae bacterium]|nr:proprotein convertase P-domain-containing protein [Kofleriaceae bacterium]